MKVSNTAKFANSHELVVYCIPNSQAADGLRQFLAKSGTRFVERDVTTSAAFAQEMMQLSGQNTSPVIVMGEHRWVGWDKSVQASLSSMLKLG